MEEFDLVIIGSGTAAQTFLASYDRQGRKIALVDCGPEFGGTCALRGCQPKKYFVSNAEVIDAAHHLAGLGIEGAIRTAWGEVLAAKNAFTEGHDAELRAELRATGIEPIEGRARFLDGETVFIEGPERTLRAGQFLVAAGTRPRHLERDPEAWVVDSTGFMNLTEMPGEVIFVGAGYISMEFAHVARRAGAEVTVLSRGERILEFFEEECTRTLIEASEAEGINFAFGANATEIRCQDGKVCVHLEDGRKFVGDLVVQGIGRIPNTDLLDVGKGNIAATRHGIEVDRSMRSVSNPRVFAIGDIAAAGPDLATVGDQQGRVVAEFLNGDPEAQMDYEVIPTNVFTLPNLSRVGRCEPEATAAGLRFRVNAGTTTGWPSSKRIGEKYSYYKILIEEGSNRILGAHLVRHHAAEVINVFALAMKYEIPTTELLKMPWAYPTAVSDLKYMIK